MSLSVCLLLDTRSERAVRQVWRRLEEAGVASLATHTHGRHVPHVSLATLRTYRREAVAGALAGLGDEPPLPLWFDALGLFRRSRCWLVPAVTPDLVRRQEVAVARCRATGADLHRHYEPGRWVPHLTLAPRLRLADLAAAARVVYDVLPLTATADRLVLVDTSTGDRWPVGTPPD